MVTIYQGDTQEFNFFLKDALGADYDLTGKVLQYRLATASGVFTVKRTDTGGSGLTVVSAPDGTANLKLTPAETAALPLGILPWELELLYGSDKYTVSTGRIEIIKGLTGG